MNERDAREAVPQEAPAPEETEDDRRRKSAELNRKATEEQWERNKREWLKRKRP